MNFMTIIPVLLLFFLNTNVDWKRESYFRIAEASEMKKLYVHRRETQNTLSNLTSEISSIPRFQKDLWTLT